MSTDNKTKAPRTEILPSSRLIKFTEFWRKLYIYNIEGEAIIKTNHNKLQRTIISTAFEYGRSNLHWGQSVIENYTARAMLLSWKINTYLSEEILRENAI